MRTGSVFLPLFFFVALYGGLSGVIFLLCTVSCFLVMKKKRYALISLLFFVVGMLAQLRDAVVFVDDFSPDFSLRERLAAMIVNHGGSPLLLSLATGYRHFSALFKHALSVTSSYHLVAISALHLGVIFLLLSSLFPLFFLWIPRYSTAWGISRLLLYAVLFWYALLTGFSLPTVRALFFFIVVDLLFASGVAVYPLFALFVSLVTVALLIPGSSETLSFHLSAVAVGGVLLVWRKLPDSRFLQLISLSLFLQWLLMPLVIPLTGFVAPLAPLIALLTIPLLTLALPIVLLLQFVSLFGVTFLWIPVFRAALFFVNLLKDTILFFAPISEHAVLPVTTFSPYALFLFYLSVVLILMVKNRLFISILTLFLLVLTWSSSTGGPGSERRTLVRRTSFHAFCVPVKEGEGILVLRRGGYGKWHYRVSVTEEMLNSVAAQCGFVSVYRIISGRGVLVSAEKNSMRFAATRIISSETPSGGDICFRRGIVSRYGHEAVETPCLP